MPINHNFELIHEQDIPELKTGAKLLHHIKTGARLLSLSNEDENKVFGITFRTPPIDSTGVPHILEHSVLCGSRKFPVKEPFVELLKGSLNTFLNAMTYPDKTCYPVASQNVQDFYNLIEVYLDAVLYPRLTPFIFQQEGWHYELTKSDDPLIYKGVVFNEMKGAYSSPDTLLREYARQSLFSDNTYGLDSGGDPRQIPNLSFEQFRDFHSKYYHPSNAWIYFYGNDDPKNRLSFIHKYLKDFERIEIDSTIGLQQPFEQPRRLIRPYASGEKDTRSKGIFTLNWLLKETTDMEFNLAMHILEHILIGMPGSPLRKALIDSSLGEDLSGGGLASELRQMYFSTGLKGIDLKDVDKIEAVILQTLARLSKEGVEPDTIEAALNTIEFRLRENNTGSYPRGLLLMLNALTTWLYNGDPLAAIAFEIPLASVKSRIASDKSFFEKIIDQYLLSNPHRTALTLRPDPALTKKHMGEERKILAVAQRGMSKAELNNLIAGTTELKKIQDTPDPPEALASIPALRLSDLERENKIIPLSLQEQSGTQILFHKLFTNGIAYLDIGFNLHSLPQKYLPYVRLFGKALLEMGTESEDYVSLSRRISQKTGGIYPEFFTSTVKNEKNCAAWLLLRGKAMTTQTGDLLDILRDVLLTANLDNRKRFHQMVLEAKAKQEQKLVPFGHQIVNLRLRAHFNESAWAAEQVNGVSYLLFLRKLAEKVDKDWQDVLTTIEDMRRILINRNAMVLNITLDERGWAVIQPRLKDFLDDLPALDPGIMKWSPEMPPRFEGMTIPSQVNYIGKGADIYRAGYSFHGSVLVISRFLRNSWLWEEVRVKGGAYGAFCLFDRLSGTFTFVSYRDPNVLKTLDVFDQSAQFLRDLVLTEDALTKAIIGAIGEIDNYRLPDAKGYISMVRHLTGVMDEELQQIREEILSTTTADFKSFARVLEAVKNTGLVKILGSRNTITKSIAEQQDWLSIINVI